MANLGTHTEPRTESNKETLSDQLNNAKIGDTVTMEWADKILPVVGKTYNRGWDWSRWKVIKIENGLITFQKVADRPKE